MSKVKEYRQQAPCCLELANAATDLFSKEAIEELAEELLKAANQLEQCSVSHGEH